MSALLLVEFTKGNVVEDRTYNAGETAGFTEDTAQFLINAGVARRVPKADHPLVQASLKSPAKEIRLLAEALQRLGPKVQELAGTAASIRDRLIVLKKVEAKAIALEQSFNPSDTIRAQDKLNHIEREITLLVDETKIADHVGVMVVGVAWEGRCLPLAWRSYRANNAVEYPAEGQVGMIKKLLEQVKVGIPARIEHVLVLADRGIGTSPDLCRVVDQLGWKYLFRVTGQSKIVTETGEYTIAQQVQPGQMWQASGRVFKSRGRIPAHARAVWSDGYNQPWALVTNAPDLIGYEYARRNWQEQSFRDLKSGGWHWGDTHIRLPDHMQRLLVILVIAYAWTIAWGSQAVAARRAQPLQRRPDDTLRRSWSLFSEGLRYFVEFLLRYAAHLRLLFIPDHCFP